MREAKSHRHPGQGAVAAGRKRDRVLVVRALSARSTRGHLAFGPMVLPCALGIGGRRVAKREGDGATPVGRLALLMLLYRGDRVLRPSTGLPSRTIARADGWCDASGDRNYNRLVRHPYPASAEALWREDTLYDMVVVLDHNRCPRRRGGGSAIFMHVARAGYLPTAGCIALSAGDLRKVLARVSAATPIAVAR